MEITDELVENYCSNRLSPEEKSAFEAELQQNPELQDQVKAQMMIEIAFKRKISETLSEKMQKAESAMQSEKSQRSLSKSSSMNARFWRLAASVSLIAVLGYGVFYLNQPSPRSNTEIFEAYFEPYQNVISATTRSNNESKSFKSLEAYELGNYLLATKFFQDEIVANPQVEELKLYYGISAGYLNDFETAQEQFDSIIANEKSGYKSQARWYKSLFAINLGHLNVAEAELIALSRIGDSYSERAEEVLRDIRRR